MDEAKFRAKAKAEGYSDAEIDAHLGKKKPEDKKSASDKQFEEAKKKQETEILGTGMSVPSNFILPAALGVGGLAAGAYAASRGGKAPPNAPTGRIEPTLDVPRLTDDLLVNPPPLPPQVAPPVPQAAPPELSPAVQQNPVQVLQEKLASAQAAAQTPVPPVEAPVAPIVEAPPVQPVVQPVIETPPVVQPVVAEPLTVPEEFKPVATEPDVPKPKAPKQTSAFIEAANKEAPTNTRFNPVKNKVGDEVIGRGAFNYVAGQEGPKAQAIWEEAIGRKNVPYVTNVGVPQYDDFKLATMAGGEPGQFPDPLAKINRESGGGAYTRPKYVPSYIKGAATPGMLGLLAAGGVTAAAFANASAKEKKNIAGEALMGFAPPVLQGMGYSKEAGETPEQMQNLARMQYEAKIGGGRGAVIPFTKEQEEERKRREQKFLGKKTPMGIAPP